MPPEKDPGEEVKPIDPVESSDGEDEAVPTGGQITPTDPTERESDDEEDIPPGCHREVWGRFNLLTCYD